MRTWEYTKIVLSEAFGRGDEIDVLCDAGKHGWELVAVLPNGVAYMKREILQDGAEYAEDVEDRVKGQTASAVSSKDAGSHVRPKYRDPATGETWSGRGRMASWLKRKLAEGEAIDKYLV